MENKTLNKLFIIIAVILLILVAIFSRTSYSNNIDKLAYAIAIGIDVGKNSSMQLSIQFSSTNEASSGSGSSQSSEAIVYSVESVSYTHLLLFIHTSSFCFPYLLLLKYATAPHSSFFII